MKWTKRNGYCNTRCCKNRTEEGYKLCEDCRRKHAEWKYNRRLALRVQREREEADNRRGENVV